jgi:L-alanine-DL-glutamate epimerase-like enolase superfamily enzyme
MPTLSIGSRTVKITAVRSVALTVPIEKPTRIATRQLGGRDYVLAWVDTDEGISGVGYTYAGTLGGRIVQAGVDALAPLLVGDDPFAIERHWARMYQESLLIGRRGALLRSISAIDIALWDTLGKALNQPLYKLIGAYRDSVPAYASGGYYREGDPLAYIEIELSQYKQLGFRDYKIKVGGAPFEVDVERVRVARETIGPTARLGLDANNAWRSPSDAIRFVRAVEKYEPWWIEEPLRPDDIAGHAEIARVLDVPVATGEIHASRYDFRDLITQRAADILQPDAGVLGGVSEWLKVAHTAASFDLPVAPHWHADVHVHLAGAVENCLTVEYFLLEEDIYNFERILTDRLRVKDGFIQIPNRPGVGLALDEAAIARYRVS